MKLFAIEEIGSIELSNVIQPIELTENDEQAYSYNTADIDIAEESLNQFIKLNEIKIFMSNNTLDNISIEGIRIATKSILCNLGDTSNTDLFLANECFKHKTTILDSNKLALEDIIDKIKEKWIKIKDIIIAMFNKILVGWTNLIKVFPHRLETIEKLILAIKGKNSPKEKTMVGKSAYAKAFIESDVNAALIKKFTDAHLEMTEFNLQTYNKWISFFKESQVSADGIKNMESNIPKKEIDLVFGNKYIYSFDHIVDDKGETDESHSFIPSIEIKKTGLVPPETVTLNVLSGSEMKSILDSTKNLVNRTTGALTDMSKKKVEIDKAIDDLSKIITTKENKEKDTSNEDKAMDVLNNFKSAVTLLSKLSAPVLYSQNLKLIDLNIDYVKNSLAKYN